MTATKLWKEPCEYCGEEIDRNGPREYRIIYTVGEQVEAYHFDCVEKFDYIYEQHIDHKSHCHVRGCEEYPKPAKFAS